MDILVYQRVDVIRFNWIRLDWMGVESKIGWLIAWLQSLKMRNVSKIGGEPRKKHVKFHHPKIHWSSDQNPDWLGYIGDGILPSYIGIKISRCKGSY